MQTPRKIYYSITEVAGMAGVKPHVLRYWETEFSALRPRKNRAGNRTYREKDVQLVLLIRRLLYEDGFTIKGARKRLAEKRSGDLEQIEIPFANEAPTQPTSEASAAAPTAAPKEEIRAIRRELESLLADLS